MFTHCDVKLSVKHPIWEKENSCLHICLISISDTVSKDLMRNLDLMYRILLAFCYAGSKLKILQRMY